MSDSAAGTGSDSLAARIVAGDRRALARTLSLIASGAPDSADTVAELRRLTREPAPVVGITGAPGVGKSTLVAALVAELRRRTRRVAVLAIDPSSPFTGGAVLGDRIRLSGRVDGGVFFRSMSSGGELGGLAANAVQALEALRHSGYEEVLLETVGVGQNEIDVHLVADVSVVVLAPGQGDDAQAAKAGLAEIADIIVVNKADQDGAREARRFAREALRDRDVGGWRPRVVSTVAKHGDGIAELVDTLDAHGRWRVGAGAGLQRAKLRARSEYAIERTMLSMLRRQPRAADSLFLELAAQVAAGTTSVRSAACELLQQAAACVAADQRSR